MKGLTPFRAPMRQGVGVVVLPRLPGGAVPPRGGLL
jgi:hypothetical protein